MVKKQLVFAPIIALVVLIAISQSPLVYHPPNVKFYETSMNKNQVHVGESAIVSLNAISNENEAKNIQVVITAIGSNADKHLTFPSTISLNDIATKGGVASEENKHITITATDVSGTETPFDIKLELMVNGVVTDTMQRHLVIVSS